MYLLQRGLSRSGIPETRESRDVVRVTNLRLYSSSGGRWHQHSGKGTGQGSGSHSTDKQVQLQGHPDAVASALAIIEARILSSGSSGSGSRLQLTGNTSSARSVAAEGRAKGSLSRGRALCKEQRWLHAAGQFTAALIHTTDTAAPSAASGR